MEVYQVILIILSALLLFAGVLLGLLYILYRLAFRGLKTPRDPYGGLTPESYDGNGARLRPLIDDLAAKESTRLSITARDGVRLYASYYHTASGAPLQILCHGYRSSAMRDMCGGAREVLKAGHNLLLVHTRAHGESEGKSITFGYKEAQDLCDWAEYMQDYLGAAPTVLVGISMGAATALIASALPLPDSVKCIIADCPYSSTEQMLKREIRKKHLPVSIFYPLMRLSARIFAGFDPRDASPVDAVKGARIPILLIHGDADGFVPPEMSREIYAACSSECELVEVASATHAMSYMVDSERYTEACHQFMSKHMNIKFD